MNEQEIMFNKLHEMIKSSLLNENTLTVLECAELINVSTEKIRELINKPNTDFPYFKIGEKVFINRYMVQKWVKIRNDYAIK